MGKYNSGFAMTHKMGLVKITLGTKSVATTRTYSASGTQAADGTGMKYTDSGTTNVTASNSFDSSCTPYSPSSGNYWYILRGSNASNTYNKTFKSVTTVNTDWEYADVHVNEGNYLNITVNNAKILRACYSYVANFAYNGKYKNDTETHHYVGGDGTVQTFKIPLNGTTVFELYGAAGGYDGSANLGGNGGRVKASKNFSKGTVCYIYVGGKGANQDVTNSGYAEGGGWNGGGNGGPVGRSGGGGGGTDVRIGGTANSNRVLVAGGGGGACNGGDAGHGGASGSGNSGTLFQGQHAPSGIDGGGGGGGYYGGTYGREAASTSGSGTYGARGGSNYVVSGWTTTTNGTSTNQSHGSVSITFSGD